MQNLSDLQTFIVVSLIVSLMIIGGIIFIGKD